MKLKLTFALLLSGFMVAILYFNQKEHTSITSSDSLNRTPAYNKTAELTKLYRIDKAYELEFEKTVSPEGIVPRDRLIPAYENLKQKQKQALHKNSSTSIWEERGPNNVGGRTRAIMFDLSDEANGYKRVFAGGVGGGIWVTNNFDDPNPSWTPVNDFLQNIAITFLAQDPTNHSHIYAGTGEGWRNADRITGIGIFKSTDGGQTFNLLPSTSSFNTTQKLIFTPAGVLYAATDQGVQRTSDGGATWEKVLGDGMGATSDNADHDYVADIELASDGTIWAGFGRIFLTGYLFKSSTGDLGSWTNAYPGLPAQRVEIAVAPSNPDIVYVLCEDPPGGPTGNDPLDPAGTNASFFYKTMDGGNIFAQLPCPRFCDQATPNNFTRNQAWYDLISAVDPSDPDIYYVGGVDCLRSTDGGINFVQISSWTGGNLCPTLTQDQLIHADHHAMVFRPGTNGEMAYGSDGGVSYSANSAAFPLPTWNTKNFNQDAGYNVTQYYACGMADVVNSTDFLAGAQDNGTQRYTEPDYDATVEVTGGDGAFCHVDQDEPHIQMSSFVFNSYWVTNNSWASDSRVTPGASVGRFINPTDYDDANNILYACAAADQFIRGNDIGSANSFSTINASMEGGQISALKVSPNTPHRLFVATDDRPTDADNRNDKVFIIDNANMANPTVTRIDGGLLPTGTGAFINCIQVEKGDDDHIVVIFSNFGQDNIWETTDGGTTWENHDGNLPDMPVRWMVFDPTDPNAQGAIIATEVGIWTTDLLNGNATDWQPTGAASNFPNVRTDMIQFREVDNFMIAATHGRGLYSTASFTGGSGGNPTLTFSQGSLQTIEGQGTVAGDCGRPHSTVNVKVALIGGLAPTVVSYTVDGSSTAKEGSDYDIINSSNQLSFAGTGGIEEQIIEVRVYDDAALDASPETLIFNISNPAGIDIGLFSSFTLNILDNDVPPALSEQNTINVINEDFAGEDFSNSDDWELNTINSTGANFWDVGISGTLSSAEAAVVTHPLAAPTDDQYDSSDADDNSNNLILQTKRMIDARGLKDLQLSFDWGAGGEVDVTNPFGPAPFDYGELVYTLDGTNYLSIGDVFVSGNSTVTSGSFDESIAFLEGQQFKLGFRWINDQLVAGAASFAVDDVMLSATPNRIESQLNASDDNYVGAGDEVYFYSENDGELIVQISDASADLGCLMTNISQAGTTNSTNFRDGKRTDKVIDIDNGTTSPYTITLYYTNAELTGFNDPTALKIAKVTGSLANPTTELVDGSTIATPITDIADGTTIIGYEYSSSVFNSFSSFFLTDATEVLPVDFLGLNAKLVDDRIAAITWQTASEIDSKGFEVERSLDNKNFEKLAFVESQGNSTVTNAYSYLDKNLPEGVLYYRLKQIDNNGGFEYSDVVSVNVKVGATTILSVAPNPFTEQFTLTLSENVPTDAQIELLDLNGRLIRVLNKNVGTQTNHTFDTNSLNLSAGVYFVRVQHAAGNEVVKIVKR